MYKTKKDIDAHVESLISKLPLKEFTSRGYSIGRLYYEVGDYTNCCRYVEQYLAVHGSNSAAHALLGLALQKLGRKKNALEHFKTSYELCPSQTSLVLNICEILADVEENIDTARAIYWCEKAEKQFPKHPVTFQLREKLVSLANPDPQALINLLLEELTVRPKDVLLNIRLVKLYLKNNNIEEAFKHICHVEFSENNFVNNYEWYETVAQILKLNPRDNKDWLFQLLLLTVTERMCVLSIAQTLGNQEKPIFESTELLHVYDQAIERVAKAGIDAGHGEFHASLLRHHRSQFAFIAATLLLKRGATRSLREAAKDAEPLMLMAWHSSVMAPSVSWVISAPEMQQKAARRWYSDGSYRCSQSGHYLLSNVKDKSQSFLDRISQNCSGGHWRNNLYGKIFSSRYHMGKINTSHLVSTAFDAPALILPKRSEVEIHDEEAQRAYGNSLHHSVWIVLKYKEYSQFKCTTFDMLPLTVRNEANCGPESLCQLDVYAFLYCASLTSHQSCSIEDTYGPSDKLNALPANITELLCTLPQMKWWDCAYKFSQNELGTEMTDIRATLSRGIEIVRCVDNHGIDAEVLCDLGRIFSAKAKLITDIDVKHSWEKRAVLYYSSAIELLQKNRDNIIKSDKCMFKKNLLTKTTKSLLEESKLYVALYELNNGEYQKAIDLLSTLKSAPGLYYLSTAYKKMALNENKLDSDNSKCVTLLSKARKYAHEARYILKDPENKSSHLILMETEELINELDLHLNEYSNGATEKLFNNSTDQYYSVHYDDTAFKSQFLFSRNFSSSPKRLSNLTTGPVSTQNINSDQQILEPTDRQNTTFQQRNGALDGFIELTKSALEEHRMLSQQIMSTINSNMQNTTDQLALLNISVDQLKYQMDKCKKESEKNVEEMKKQMAELRKDISKLKKASEQTVNENVLFNLDEGYAANEGATTFAGPLPFTPQQVIPPFNQRLIPPFTVPPNPFHLYGQNLFNLYSQFSQPSSMPGAPPIFDPARSQVNYPGVFPTPDQMYLDVAHLVQQTMPNAPSVPVIPVPASVSASAVNSTLPVSIPHSTAPITSSMPKNVKAKDIPRSLPANVVITSSDPLPTCTSAPTPVLSVTIPPKHIKGIPHNYQIQMPDTEPTPAFGFPALGNKISPSTVSSNWSQNALFKDAFSTTNAKTTASSLTFSPKFGNTSGNSESLVDTANNSYNKSRTLSEKSNTSIDNYDPCPDFKPIIPLPAEVKVTTGEEDETAIFSARAKLYRFVENQWKERGLGEMKLLKHEVTGKVRVLMRREQIHKICANHAITSYMEIKPMKNETKAYFWVANDFADETLVLEKFCVRFKTADIARQFYETFEKARSEAIKGSTDSEAPLNLTTGIPDKVADKKEIPKPDLQTTSTNNSQPAKTVFGGFTFSSTPAFKAVDDSKLPGNAVANSTPTKVNVFSGLNFKPGIASSPFSTLFGTLNSQTNNTNTPVQNTSASDKLNTSDTVEDYEPTGEFTPVVPLPELVDTKTGEEDEIILFEHRAKLLRFVSKEWKERGLGNIKLLVNKDNVQKLRLLMRREQVMKVCCNHAVTKAMTFQKMPNVEKAVTWCAQDFSEGELTPETFCLRFKTVQACNDFIHAVKSAQSKLKDDSKAAKEELNAAKQNSQSASVSAPNKPFNWSDKFKPKVGSWECKECLVRNEANVENCLACSSPKNPGSIKPDTKMPETKTAPNTEMKFKFGIAQQYNSVKTAEQVTKPPMKSTWGDMFKPSVGTWECKQCFVRNESDADTCCACNSSKDPNAANKPVTATWPTPKFNFGIPPTQVTGQQKTDTTSIFDGTGAHKFNFGIPSILQTQSADVMSKNDSTLTGSNVAQGTGNTNDTVQGPTQKENKPALLPTPQKPPEAATFDFVFKLKTQTKAKSPIKSPKNDKGEESDGDEYASEDDGHHIHVTPIVPLPDKVKVVTGEEDEDELFGHRAKLLIFVAGEWKERGIGIVKILKHKHTSKLRVIMRREQVFKICLNHALTNDISYNLKDEKNWIFAANDFSEGELTVQRFCLKFKTKDIAMQFKDTVDKARSGTSNLPQQNQNVAVKADNDNDDVEFITETKSDADEKKKALELMLPENFFLYKDKEPCPGCRGCESDKESITLAKNDDSISSPMGPLNDTQYFTPEKIQTPKLRTTSWDEDDSPFENDSSSVKETIQKPKFVPTDNASLIFRPPIFHSPFPSLETTCTSNNRNADPKSIFASANLSTPDSSTLFGFKSNNTSNPETKSIFGTVSNSKLDDTQNPENKSIFGFSGGAANQKPFNLFTQNERSLFGQPKETTQPDPTSSFPSSNAPVFGNGKSIWTFDAKTDSKPGENKSELVKLLNKTKEEEISTNRPSQTLPLLGSDNLLSFSAFSSQPEIKFEQNPNFMWEGAGQQLFAQASKPKNAGDGDNENETGNGGEEEYDPHYEPIVPLPDKITVTTGEEDEEKLFGKRCKLFRFNDATREWKERGVGELKILYHPEKKTYRLLFRREQVHKAVLNMLLFMDLELLPMNKTDRAWTWAGLNYAENPAGDQETLAVRFKTLEIATEFFEKVKECVRKLQAAAAQAIREQKEAEKKPIRMDLLRLPKHLQDSDRADTGMSAESTAQPELASAELDPTKRVLFRDVEQQEEASEEDTENYQHEQVYYQCDDYDTFYNEEEESGAYFSCDCEAEVQQGSTETTCAQAHVQVLFDHALFAPKIQLTNVTTGELLADMLVHDDTEFQLSDATCSWSGTDYTSNDPVETTVTVTFPDSETAMQFYDSCESSKEHNSAADADTEA